MSAHLYTAMRIDVCDVNHVILTVRDKYVPPRNWAIEDTQACICMHVSLLFGTDLYICTVHMHACIYTRVCTYMHRARKGLQQSRCGDTGQVGPTPLKRDPPPVS